MDAKPMSRGKEEHQAEQLDDATQSLQRSAAPQGALFLKPATDSKQRRAARIGHRVAAAAVACLAARANAVT